MKLTTPLAPARCPPHIVLHEASTGFIPRCWPAPRAKAVEWHRLLHHQPAGLRARARTGRRYPPARQSLPSCSTCRPGTAQEPGPGQWHAGTLPAAGCRPLAPSCTRASACCSPRHLEDYKPQGARTSAGLVNGWTANWPTSPTHGRAVHRGRRVPLHLPHRCGEAQWRYISGLQHLAASLRAHCSPPCRPGCNEGRRSAQAKALPPLTPAGRGTPRPG